MGAHLPRPHDGHGLRGPSGDHSVILEFDGESACPKTKSEKNRPADATRLHPDGARQLDLRSRLLPREQPLAVEIHQDWIEAHNYLEHGNVQEQRKRTSTNWRSSKLNAHDLFTNRLLWLSASAGALAIMYDNFNQMIFHSEYKMHNYYYSSCIDEIGIKLGKLLAKSDKIHVFPDATLKSNNFPNGIAIYSLLNETTLIPSLLRDPGCGFLTFKIHTYNPDNAEPLKSALLQFGTRC